MFLGQNGQIGFWGEHYKCVPAGAIHAPAHIHTPRDRATYVRTYGRYTHARVRTRVRESSDLKGKFNYNLLRLKVFLNESCKFLTYIEPKIFTLMYKIFIY